MKSVLLMFVAMALIFATAATRIAISENGYSNVLFAVSPDVPPADSQQIIDNIKLMINEASSVLYRATRYRSYFREVRILIPETWSHIDANRTWGNWDEADVRIGPSGPNGDRPYTQQLGGCGEHGQFIHFTPNYLLNMNEAAIIEKYGAPGKVFVHEWAHLRYGVFDEYAEPGDEKYPLFYRRPNTRTPLPNLCTSSPTIHHNAKDVVTGERCNVDANGDYDANCRFELLPQFKPQSSLMSLPSLDSVEDFCDNGQTVPHNIDAPNRHNDMCQGQSVWQVVESNEDFQNRNMPNEGLDVTPEISIVRSDPRFVLVVDVSDSMNKLDRLRKVNEAARRWILNDLPTGSSLAIVQFSAQAEKLSEFEVITATTRGKVVNALPSSTQYPTCIGCGLKLAFDTLMEMGEGGHIVLVTDGKNTPGFLSISDVLENIIDAKIPVITIALGREADPLMETLAERTGGKGFLVTDANAGAGIQDALRAAGSLNPYSQGNSVKLLVDQRESKRRRSKRETDGDFRVDSTVGRNTELQILNVNRHLIHSVTLTDPNNRTINANLTPDVTPSILLPSAVPGAWKFRLVMSEKALQNPTVIVTTQHNYNSPFNIETKCWFSKADVRDASNTQIKIYAEITMNNFPVVNATVRAYVEKPDGEVEELKLEDSGVGADSIAGDGTYSKFFTKPSHRGRYTVLCHVVNEGEAYVHNEFIASFISVRDSYLESKQIEHQSPVEQFARIENAGSFRVEIPVSQDDAYPPGRVTDLTATVVDAANRMLEIKWTAPGDDLDSGAVSYYEMKYSTDIQQLRDSFEVDNPLLASIDQDDVVDGSLTPLEVGSTQIATISLPMETGVPYVLALRAVDKAGKKSSVSNIARFYLDEPQELANSEEFSFDYVPEKDKIDEDPVVADFESAGSEYVDGSADSEDVNDTADSEDDYDTVDRKDDYDIAENVAYGSPDTKYDATELPVDHFRPIFTKEKAETESSSTAYFIGASCALGVIIVAAVVIRRLCLSMYREYKTVPV